MNRTLNEREQLRRDDGVGAERVTSPAPLSCLSQQELLCRKGSAHFSPSAATLRLLHRGHLVEADLLRVDTFPTNRQPLAAAERRCWWFCMCLEPGRLFPTGPSLTLS